MPLIVEGFPQSPAVRDASGRRYSRYFTVEAASEADVENLLDVHEGVRYGATYTNWRDDVPDPGAVVVNINVQPLTQVPETGSGLFSATVDYGYVSRTVRPPQTIYTAPRMWVEESLVTVPADVDYQGRPIANAANEIYDPPPTTTIVQEVLIIEWTKLGPDWLTVRNQVAPYLNKTNSAIYKGAPIQCLKCVKMRVDEQAVPYIVSGQFQFKTRAEFQFSPEITVSVPSGFNYSFPGWHIVKRNIGRRILNSASGGPEYIQIREGMSPGNTTVDPAASFITDPVDIESTGTDLAPVARYRGFQMLQTIDFNGLGV